MTDNARAQEKPRVCVVIPTRNRHDSLAEAISTVLEQNLEGIEIVVVDEASSPPVADILDLRDERIRIIRNDPPLGPGGARNKGSAATQAEFIAFLDDDDRWLAGKLHASLSCFETHSEAGMVFHQTALHGASTQGSGSCRVIEDAVHRMLSRQPPHVDSVVIRRNIHDVVLFDESFRAAEELDYLLRVAEKTTIVELDEVFAEHGPHTQPSYIGLETRIRARKQLRTKHAHRFEAPEIVAFYYVRLGHLYRRAGHRGRSFGCFVRALAKRPGSGHAWRGLVISLLPYAFVDHVRSRVRQLRVTFIDRHPYR